MRSGKVNWVRAGGGFLGRQSMKRENRKGIPGHGWAEAGRKHVGEGGREGAELLLMNRNHLLFLPSYLLCCPSSLFPGVSAP